MSLSLAAVLAEPAARRPDHPAIVFDGQEVSYARLWHRARSYAAVLGERGVRPGDRVALLLSNTPHFAMAYFGALAAGAVVVPVHALLKAEEIAYVLRDSGARLLVCGGAFLGEGAKAAEMAGVEVLTVLAPGSRRRAASTSWPSGPRRWRRTCRAPPPTRPSSCTPPAPRAGPRARCSRI